MGQKTIAGAAAALLFSAWIGCAGEGSPGLPDIQLPFDTTDASGGDSEDDSSTGSDADTAIPDALADAEPDADAHDSVDDAEDGDADGADGSDADADVAWDADTAADADTSGCVTPADCVGKVEHTPCEVLTCSQQGVCGVAPSGVEACCTSSADCDDGSAVTVDSCPAPGASCSHVTDPTACDGDEVLLDVGFDSGLLPSGWQTLDFDLDTTVNWRITSRRSHAGLFSVGFGREDCPTYYDGPMSADCAPLPLGAKPLADQDSSILSPEIALPAGQVVWLALSVWVDLELVGDPALPDCDDAPQGQPCFDAAFEELVGDHLRLYVNYVEEQGGTFIPMSDLLWTSVAIKKTTSGVFARLGADLSGYAGKSIQLEFEATADAGYENLDHEGIYVDSIRVQTGCGQALCSKDADCASPNPCVDATCTAFVNVPLGGCFGLEASGCEPCLSGQDFECDDGDACTEDACESQRCARSPALACCEEASVYGVFDFETGKLPPGWKKSGGAGAVGWGVAKIDATSGESHLYFGDPAAGSYESAGAVSGHLTTPVVLVPDTAGLVVGGFQLRLETEWEAGSEPSLDFPADRFTLSVLSNEGGLEQSTVVFDSFDIGGTTASAPGLAPYKGVSFDLTAFAGQSVRLRFAFDTWDDVDNDFAGVFIDDFGISTVCEPPSEPCAYDDACDDSDACTTDTCDLGGCLHTQDVPSCCGADADCDDGNPCTVSACQDGACVLVDPGEASCCFAGTSAFEDFEGSGGGWTLSSADPAVVWRFAKDPTKAWAGDGFLAFGDPATGTYATSTGGTALGQATSPPLIVPTGGASTLRFRVWLETEYDSEGFPQPLPVDLLRLYAAVGDDDLVLLWGSDEIGGTTGGQWQDVEASLGAVAGQAVQLVFEFDSWDAEDNDYEGARIDGIERVIACD
jgi:hypothetical protein